MSAYRFARLPSNGSVAAAVTLVVSGWLTLAAASMLADGHAAAPAQPQRATAMAAAAPAPATPLPLAAAPEVREKIVVEAQRLVAVPSAYEKIVVEAPRARA